MNKKMCGRTNQANKIEISKKEERIILKFKLEKLLIKVI